MVFPPVSDSMPSPSPIVVWSPYEGPECCLRKQTPRCDTAIRACRRLFAPGMSNLASMTDTQPSDPRVALIDYAESAIVEDDALVAARARGIELGAIPVSPSVGALLAVLARAVDAHAVAEIGTGTGVSGLWLLAGMATDGVLTTIDPELEHHQAARASFAGATSRRVGRG